MPCIDCRRFLGLCEHCARVKAEDAVSRSLSAYEVRLALDALAIGRDPQEALDEYDAQVELSNRIIDEIIAEELSP